LIYIITNQSGIARGYYSVENFLSLTEYMREEFKKHDITIDSVEFCPHLPEANCTCRKPKTGMIDNILKKTHIDLSNSWLIGDKQSDIDLAINAGIGYKIAIGKREISNSDYKFDTIYDAYEFLKDLNEFRT
jgi:D-glycero-D-manno-heptose 1,7-bisphosphate phosphatase